MVCQNRQLGLDQPLRLLELHQRLVDARDDLRRSNGFADHFADGRVAQLMTAIETCCQWVAAPRQRPASEEQVSTVAAAVDRLEREVKTLCHCLAVMSGPRLVCP